MSISDDLAYQLEQQRLEKYRVVVEGAGNRKAPADTPQVDREAVAEQLRQAWAPKKAEGSK